MLLILTRVFRPLEVIDLICFSFKEQSKAGYGIRSNIWNSSLFDYRYSGQELPQGVLCIDKKHPSSILSVGLVLDWTHFKKNSNWLLLY